MFAGNILLHSILKESKRLPKMKKFLFKHALDQEMSFYDEKTVGDIKSAMDPMAIVDIISWRVPFLVAEIFKLLFIIHNMILMNWQLTVSSLAFQVISLGYMYDRYTGNLLSMCRKICF